ncbi:YqaA family protein [Xanthobacter oligotrophicus]|uniref:YqaA family protein n=1 Tax=Xanthobacter oligotrophicus TaxID=2607286 RepID=A0ABW7A2Z7_9HYPH
MTELPVYLGLFLAALAAATILPMQSEALFAGLLLADYPLLPLLVAASAGNVLGSVLNWGLGRGIERFSGRRWFPVSEAALARAQRWYRRYGKWSLLLSWMPVIGDPLTVVAGLLREPFATFLLIVAFAKIGRYAALAAVTLHLA